MLQVHPIPPLYSERSRVLILGSFPSVRSRQDGFFYAHPQNRFWRVLASLCRTEVPQSIPQKRELVLKNGFALWDVIASCEIEGSADSSIKAVRPNDLSVLFAACPHLRVFTNGKTAYAYYQRYQLPQNGVDAVCLPSTSPANASWSFEDLCDAWRVIL